ncbi:kinetochore protein ndc80 [Tripterygium wilfordii]|uniref:Kinetochore protein NDC80 n=1 Tax=Tripterygium wilfordii TaxID=458696 RepID=A0A7J7CCW8_TRIWF|nr:kinetochore protein NDC80 homolog [Tripterygium wilfordii]KAF5731973.1 kinetochore protein ndc80 [Tripterygium wilfordii]
MRGASIPNRRGPPRRESFNPPDSHYRQFANTSRDSDASFASSRPSSVGMGARPSTELYTDRSHQQSAIRAINAYLASRSFPLSLKPHQAPSVKEITEALKFVISRLDFSPSSKLEDDLSVILKSLNCPFKFNKSTLRAPNTPHNWPTYLALIHWLVQIAMYNEHLMSSSQSFVENNSMYMYALRSYLHFIRGDDDAEEALNQEFLEKLEKERDSVAESIKTLERNAGELAAKAESLRTGPTEKEELEKQRSVLEEDVKKFYLMIEGYNEKIGAMEKGLEEKEKELSTKEEEKRRICDENDELKKRVELQTFNARDMERMKRELQAVERDIGETEAARNAWEEKSWELDVTIGQKFKELEALSMECNQAIRRLKIAGNLQYVLNAKGSNPTEVMGVDYKSALKPAFESFADDLKKSSMARLEESISLQQQSSEMTAKIEGKRNQIAALQSHVDEVETKLNFLRKETEEYVYRCAAEAKKMREDVQNDANDMDAVEREAAEFPKASKTKLEETTKQVEEEIQKRAGELFALVDSVSKYKEYVESKISEMKNSLSETAVAVSDTCKASMAAQLCINNE